MGSIKENRKLMVEQISKLKSSLNEAGYDRELQRLDSAKDFQKFFKKHKSKIDKQDARELKDEIESFKYMEFDLQDLENDGEDTYNEKIELDTAREELIDLLSKSLE